MTPRCRAVVINPLTSPARAGESAGSCLSPSSEAPVEISASHSLEWNRKAKTYTARENAVAKQGATEVSSRLLIADYRDDKGATDVWRLTAQDNVTIKSPPYTATGDKAVYDVAAGRATLTGKDLKITTPTESLTAQEKIEFFTQENRLSAVGQATAVRGTDRLGSAFTFAAAAYNLVRLPKLLAA